ncbi:hypothetical protein pdam_00002202 [Pocillopora damicornis]|uniref:Heparanase n=1 Tax=Pocillopora damicornis TaxID=46731 RepID=A0A3M6U1K5_POCDA|nr:hypothetical protein pdam_00002202 [Pocillopora damicornis]
MKRFKDGSWDPSNALRIMTYVAKRRYQFGWQLGNEPNHLQLLPFGFAISPEQLAKDFKKVRTLLAQIHGINNFLVGPDVTQPRLAAILSFIIIAVVIMRFFMDSRDFSRVNFHAPLSGQAKVIVTKIVNIKMREEIARIEEHFVSICLTWRTILEWNFNYTTEKRIITLMKALSPAYVRIGGDRSQFVLFQAVKGKENKLLGIKTFNISGEEFVNGSWDPSNALKIIKYVAERGYKFKWELGNEPNHLRRFGVTIPPEQLAEDFKQLRGLLSTIPGVHNFLVGPDVTQPRGNAMGYLQRFLKKGSSSLDAVTWHHYYVRGEHCSLPQFYVPQTLDTLLRDIKEVDEVISQYAPGLPRWFGETASVSGGGADGISGRFVAGFMWLNKLGMAAQHGLYKRGAITLMAMNLHPEREANLTLKDIPDHDIDEFLFTPDGDITSRRIKLNGKVLEMGPGSFFPTFQPIRIPRANQVILPPLTYAFYVVPEANAKACLESTKKRP